MSVDMPREFVGTAPRSVAIAGGTYQVSPLTMGQLHQLKRAFRELPPPQPVVVEVRGLIEAMLRPADENGHAPADPMAKLTSRLMNPMQARKDITEAVVQTVREARGRQEQWPPDPTTPQGQELILSDDKVQVEFIRILLAKHHPEITVEEATRIRDEADIAEYQDLVDAAFRTVQDRNRRLMDEQLSDPKFQEKLQLLALSNSGGVGAG